MYSNSLGLSNEYTVSATSKAHMKYLKSKINMGNMNFIDTGNTDKSFDKNESKDDLLLSSMFLTKQQRSLN